MPHDAGADGEARGGRGRKWPSAGTVAVGGNARFNGFAGSVPTKFVSQVTDVYGGNLAWQQGADLAD